MKRTARWVLAAVLPLLLLAGAGEALAKECAAPPGLKKQAPRVAYFEVDSTEIRAEDQEWLTELAERYRGNPQAQFCVLGQADKSGDVAYNEDLALRRARAVVDFLKAQGLGNKKFQVLTRGEAFGDTWLGRVFDSEQYESDRRVEVVVMR
jgi:outer membrane protein OmpA-like peptidoglycan-associated protein